MIICAKVIPGKLVAWRNGWTVACLVHVFNVATILPASNSSANVPKGRLGSTSATDKADKNEG